MFLYLPVRINPASHPAVNFLTYLINAHPKYNSNNL